MSNHPAEIANHSASPSAAAAPATEHLHFKRTARPRLALSAGLILYFNRILLAAIFIFAAWGKLANPRAFASAVGAFHLLPERWLIAAALMLIWLEMLTGFFLAAGLARRGAALLAAAMSCLFFAFILSARLRGLDIDCGCFGAFMRGGIGGWSIVRPLIMLAMSLAALRWPRE